MEPEIAAVATCIIMGTVYLVVSEARRIRGTFFLEEEDTVSFEELREVFPDRSVKPRGTPPPPGRAFDKDT